MINIFRKKRKSLADDNKVIKYTRYAIGEIALVVIGILIALQINTWNEQQKEKKSERSILTEIRSNLTFDLLDFESNILTFQNKILSSKTLLKLLNSNTSYNDSIGYYFSYLNAYPHFSSKTNGYKLLEIKGLDLILNDSLRNSITDLYEDRYNYILTYEKERISYNKNQLENAMIPYNGIETLSLEVKPKSIIIKGSSKILADLGYFRNIRNYSQLKEDKDFHGMIKNVEIWSSALEFIHSSAKRDVIKLIMKIDKELEN